MKNLVLLLISTLSFGQIDVNAEEVYPYWEKEEMYKIKDINDPNHLFDQYVGNWTGTYEGRRYLFKIETHITHPRGETDFIHRMLKITYNVSDENGNYLANFICPNGQLCAAGPEINLGYLMKDGVTYKSFFFGANTACGNSGYIFIKHSAEHILELKFEKTPFSKYECKDGTQFLMPKGDSFTLAKE